jgi:hypothetical protein
MLARLWWKEARVFWPFWVTLGLVAVLVQWFALRYGGHGATTGVLTYVALFWAVVYAFAVGAAAFAGEREQGTLTFLDTLPVGRPTLWAGKASFAIVTTLALATAMVALSMMGTTLRDPREYGLAMILLWLGTMAIEAAAWGLFWSSWVGNALAAAILAIASVGLISTALSGPNLEHMKAGPSAIRLALAVAAAAGSYRVMVARPRPGRPGRGRPSPAPAPGARAVYASTLEFSEPSRRLAAASTVGRLAWETVREGAAMWAGLTALGLVFPLFSTFLLRWLAWTGPSIMIGVALTLAAGVCVFGLENRARTFRFYVHHGVRPGTVWIVKVLVWIGAVLASWGIAIAVVAMLPRSGLARREEIVVLAALAFHAFALGQFCGLVIRRGITAGVAALLLLFLVSYPQITLVIFKMVPAWGLMIVPAMLLAISWAWSGEWMLDRDGPRRWVRLALLVIIPFGMLFTGYAAARAWGVPDVPSPYAGADVRPEPVPPDQDAAEGYRAAIARIRGGEAIPFQSRREIIDPVIVEGWVPDAQEVVDYWRDNREAIEMARRASSRPRGQFTYPPDMTLYSGIDPAIGKMLDLWGLLALDARERQSRGDLTGAWEDIRAGFRMAEVVATSALMTPMMTSYAIDQSTSRLAISWACDPRQTADSLRSALDDVRKLTPLPSLEGVVKREALAEEKAIDMPMEELLAKSYLFGPPSFLRSLLAPLAVNPWERERARRVLKLLTSDELELARSESWQYWNGRVNDPRSLAAWRNPTGPQPWKSHNPAHDQYLESTYLLKLLHPALGRIAAARDLSLMLRRALEQVLALRLWKVEHGTYPDSLAKLVPAEFPSLPLDPYSGRPFGYVASTGQELLLLERVGTRVRTETPKLYATRPGQMLLYSVGPDGSDDGASKNFELREDWPGDYIFPLPDREPPRDERR